MLSFAELRQNSGLLTLLLEAPDGALNGLVFLDPNSSHGIHGTRAARRDPHVELRRASFPVNPLVP